MGNCLGKKFVDGSVLVASLALARMRTKAGEDAVPEKKEWLCLTPAAGSEGSPTHCKAALRTGAPHILCLCDQPLCRSGPVDFLLSWEDGQCG